MVRVSVATCSFYGEKHHLVNLFRSLVLLKPELVCIADTSRADPETVVQFHHWLRFTAELYDLPIAITNKPFDGSYKNAKNRALDMGAACSDWQLLIDSDEMLSKQAAGNLRDYLGGLSQHVLAVRIRKFELLDDDRACFFRNLWPAWLRRNKGAHPRIVRSGTGRYKGQDIHEVYQYPGRNTIPFHSPEHPKVDWHGSYGNCLLHLWIYKDNMMRRKCGRGLDITKMPLNVSPGEAYKAAKALWIKGRGYVRDTIPKEVTWVPVIWMVEPEKWVLRQVGNKWTYKLYYGQGGR